MQIFYIMASVMVGLHQLIFWLRSVLVLYSAIDSWVFTMFQDPTLWTIYFSLLFVAVIGFWVMISSRCLAPCCCEMPDTPKPCPPGKCSCSNLVLLDYPMLVAPAVTLGFEPLVVFINRLYWEYYTSDPYSEPLIEISREATVVITGVGLVLALLAPVAGIRKYCLLRPTTDRMGERGEGSEPAATVVGSPVQCTEMV